MAKKLTEDQVRQKLQEGRNYKLLYSELKYKFDALLLENKQLKAQLDKQDDQNDGLRAEVKVLSEQVRKLTDSTHRYRFYLFRQSKVKAKKEDRKPAKRDKASYARPQPRPSEITNHEELTLNSCPGCHGLVSDSVEAYVTYVEDIVYEPKSVTEYTIHRHWCGNCHKLVRAPIPNTLPGMSLGLNTVLFVLTEHYRAKKTDEQIVESLDRYFGLNISLGEISEIRHAAAAYFGKRFKELVNAIREARVIYADETGWLVEGGKGFCWNISAPELPAVLYKIADTRAKDELQSILGENFNGITVSDFYPVYDGVGSDQQKCWVHLLRDSHLLVQASPRSRQRQLLHTGLSDIYQQIKSFQMAKWKKRKARKLEQKLDAQLSELANRSWKDKECQRLAKRITKYRKQLLTCVRIPGVRPENNTAERNLRPVVVHRKITHGNRSVRGAQTYEVNKSIIETMALEGGDLLNKLRDTLWQAAWSKKFGVTSLE
jgi:transposase